MASISNQKLQYFVNEIFAYIGLRIQAYVPILYYFSWSRALTNQNTANDTLSNIESYPVKPSLVTILFVDLERS